METECGCKTENLDGVLWGEVLLFPDGSIKERTAYGVMIKPDTDKRRAELVVEYWKTKAKLAVSEFDLQRNQRLRYARTMLKQGHAPNERKDDAVRILTELQRKVLFCRKQLQKAEQELNKVKAVSPTEEMADLSMEMATDYLREIEQIEI